MFCAQQLGRIDVRRMVWGLLEYLRVDNPAQVRWLAAKAGSPQGMVAHRKVRVPPTSAVLLNPAIPLVWFWRSGFVPG